MNDNDGTIETIGYKPELREQIRASIVYYRAGKLRICDRIAGTIAVVAGGMMFFAGEWKWWPAILILFGLSEWSDLLHLHSLQAWVFFKRNPKFREEHNLAFSTDGILYKTSSIESQLAWSLFDTIIEDSILFLLRYGKSLYSVIPKRIFKTEADLDRFRSLLQAKIPKYQSSNA